MQNLESAGAVRSISTQTGSMTGECRGPSSRSRRLSLCRDFCRRLASGSLPGFSPLFACASASECLIPGLGASPPWSPGLPGSAPPAFEVVLTAHSLFPFSRARILVIDELENCPNRAFDLISKLTVRHAFLYFNDLILIGHRTALDATPQFKKKNLPS